MDMQTSVQTRAKAKGRSLLWNAFGILCFVAFFCTVLYLAMMNPG